MKINQRVLDSTELLIKKIAAETAALVAGGAKLVNMSQGVPCLPIFDEAQSAIVEAVQSKQLPYTDVTGMLSVRQTCASFVNQFYSNDTFQMHFDAANIVVTAGAIQAICNVLSMTVDCADDVVMTTLPAYGLYIHQTRMLGGTFAALPTNAAAGFVPTAADVRSFFRQFDVPATATAPARNRVRAVVLCFPNNPTGAMLTREQAQELAEALDAELRADPQGFALILDEVYLGICNREFFSISQFASPQLLANTFIVLSASKGLGAMPGARAAWLTCGDAGVVQHLIKVQSAASANASSLAQVGLKGSLEAVMNRPEILHQVAAFYGARTSYIVSRLNRIGALFGICSEQQPIARPCDATFYVWADFGGLRTDKAATDTDLVRALRDRYQVQLTPAQRCTTNALEVRQVHEKLLDDEHVLHLSEEIWAEQARPQLLSTLAGESTGAGVAIVPGSAFLCAPEERRVRFSCARPRLAELRLALDVLELALRDWLQ